MEGGPVRLDRPCTVLVFGKIYKGDEIIFWTCTVNPVASMLVSLVIQGDSISGLVMLVSLVIRGDSISGLVMLVSLGTASVVWLYHHRIISCDGLALAEHIGIHTQLFCKVLN